MTFGVDNETGMAKFATDYIRGKKWTLVVNGKIYTKALCQVVNTDAMAMKFDTTVKQEKIVERKVLIMHLATDKDSTNVENDINLVLTKGWDLKSVTPMLTNRRVIFKFERETQMGPMDG